MAADSTAATAATEADPDASENVADAELAGESIISDPVVAQVLADFEQLDTLSPAQAAEVLAQGVHKLEAVLAKDSGR
ncbi:MAG: hypothetical protein K0U64_01285 [Actinomycetia bacterium]|nr:hypothetical protein [Actinomycetes bacterium]